MSVPVGDHSFLWRLFCLFIFLLVEFFHLLLLDVLELFWGECVLYCSGCVLFFVSVLVHFVIVRSLLFLGMKKPSPGCESWGGSFLVALDQS